MAGDVFFESDNGEVTRALDRDTRIGVAALICALAIGAAASGAGHTAGGAPPGTLAPAAQSDAPAVFGLPAAPPAAVSNGAHAASGAS